MLATAATEWSSPDLSLEQKIIKTALEVVTEGRMMDRRDEVMHALSAVNPSIKDLVEGEG